MLKNIKMVLVAIGCLSLAVASCQKYDGDSYDFSNKEVNYTRLSNASTPVTVNGDVEVDSLGDPILDSLGEPYPIYKPVNVTVETRMAFTEDINYTYVIKLNGFETKTGAGVIKMGATNSKISLDYPESAFPSGIKEAEGTIELIGANGTKYGDLRMGYPNVGDNLKISLDVIKPRTL